MHPIHNVDRSKNWWVVKTFLLVSKESQHLLEGFTNFPLIKTWSLCVRWNCLPQDSFIDHHFSEGYSDDCGSRWIRRGVSFRMPLPVHHPAWSGSIICVGRRANRRWFLPSPSKTTKRLLNNSSSATAASTHEPRFASHLAYSALTGKSCSEIAAHRAKGALRTWTPSFLCRSGLKLLIVLAFVT